ncbi:hypothetical protein J1605_021840 [Eschrichtius robustus]|uniref:Uncharacterized protein n=1 Tax=Eschrichtius robustus TaxID=9764 RepID=A0AB34HDG8_ESCRO|nr:hypothetical protein J1605_021840 [Eschrichtius robustus]
MGKRSGYIALEAIIKVIRQQQVPPIKGMLCPNIDLESTGGTSLVAQWLRIRLPVQGTRVRALVQEDPTCRGASNPVRHNY